jgi:DNA-binding cell septation regulator SpoVG
MSTKINDTNLEITEIQIWPMRNPEASRVKAKVSITFNNVMRVNGCKIIESSNGPFLSFPSEKRPGTEQYFPIFHFIDRQASNAVQAAVLERFNALAPN